MMRCITLNTIPITFKRLKTFAPGSSIVSNLTLYLVTLVLLRSMDVFRSMASQLSFLVTDPQPPCPQVTSSVLSITTV
jgi:hypothetical protein